MSQIEKSIKRDALKFEHHIMIQGLREVDEIARARNLKADMLIIGLALEALNEKREKLGLPRKRPQYVEPVWKKTAPEPKPPKNPFDNFWTFKVKPNDKTPVCKWKDPGSPPG